MPNSKIGEKIMGFYKRIGTNSLYEGFVSHSGVCEKNVKYLKAMPLDQENKTTVKVREDFHVKYVA